MFYSSKAVTIVVQFKLPVNSANLLLVGYLFIVRLYPCRTTLETKTLHNVSLVFKVKYRSVSQVWL